MKEGLVIIAVVALLLAVLVAARAQGQLCNGRPCPPECVTTCNAYSCTTRCFQR
jgi:hypothetical protein